MSDFYTSGLADAEFEFKIRVQMRARYQSEENYALGGHDNAHLISPSIMIETLMEKIYNSARDDNKDLMVNQLEEFFTFRLFEMLGVKTLPPTIVNGQPSKDDFSNPEFVEVLQIEEL